jgi:hypothetical protein
MSTYDPIALGDEPHGDTLTSVTRRTLEGQCEALAALNRGILAALQALAQDGAE